MRVCPALPEETAERGELSQTGEET